MKQSIYCTKLLFIIAIIMFTSCEEDPVVPIVNCRNANLQIINNIPDNITGYDIRDRFLFCIDECLYMKIEYYENINNDRPWDNQVIYEYNTITNEWTIVWYISSIEVEQLQKGENPDDWEKAQKLMEMSESLHRSQCGNCCGYNGKGYIYDNNGRMLEFNPLTKEMTSHNNADQLGYDVRLFSNAKGVFGYSKSYNILFQYALEEHQWKEISSIYEDELIRFLSDGYQTIDNPNDDKIHVWTNYSNTDYSITSYVYPYDIIENRYNIIPPHDYGWNNYSYYSYNDYTAALFTINGKLYKGLGDQIFYEYNPIDQSINLIVAGTEQYHFDLPLAVIGNKLYSIASDQLVSIEF